MRNRGADLLKVAESFFAEAASEEAAADLGTAVEVIGITVPPEACRAVL